MTFSDCFDLCGCLADMGTTSKEHAEGAFELWYAIEHKDYQYIMQVILLLAEGVKDDPRDDDLTNWLVALSGSVL